MASLITNHYSEQSSQLMFPRQLLLVLVHTNTLRSRRRMTPDPYEEIYGKHMPMPGELLEDVVSFLPNEWAESITASGKSSAGLALLGSIYQTATLLFCITSLSSASHLVLDDKGGLATIPEEHRDELFSLLERGLSTPATNKCCLWPLAVFGALLTTATDARRSKMEAQREFVRGHCTAMSRSRGDALPLMLKNLLEAHWASGRTDWDSCFTQSYPFTV